jgi:hypothetical protein
MYALLFQTFSLSSALIIVLSLFFFLSLFEQQGIINRSGFTNLIS